MTFRMIAASLLVLTFGLQAKEIEVVQKEKKFSVDSVVVNQGDTIVFKNEEANLTHNVYSTTPGHTFSPEVQKPGQKTALLIDANKFAPGEMLVECAIHPKMKLKVKIEAKK